MTSEEYDAKIERLKQGLLAFIRQKGREVDEREIVDAFAGREISEVCVSDVLRQLKKNLTLNSTTRKVGRDWLTFWSSVRSSRQLF